MIVGFTGTQRGMTAAQKQCLSKWLTGAAEFHHGLCIGSDQEAHEIAKAMGIPIVGHPPRLTHKMMPVNPAEFVELWRPKDYLVRNRDIVDTSVVLIGTPGERTEQLRSGTWSTIRYARRQNKRIVVIYPDGRL